MTRLRYGILGTGNIARQFAEGVAKSHRAQIVAVASRSQTGAEAFAQAYGIDRAYGSYDAILDDDSVDAVYVSLPNSMHCGWTLKLLAAGKHVLCEKPIASNVAEAEQMFDAAQRYGRVLMEAFMYRCHPQTRAVIEHVRSGTIGQLRLIRTAFCYRAHLVEGNIRFDPKLAGGALMDIGCYCVSLARAVVGEEPVEIHGVGHLHESGVDDYAAGVLRFPSGVVCEFCCGMSVQTDNTAWICGSDGYLEVPWPWKPPFPVSRYVVNAQVPPRQDQGKSERRPREEYEIKSDCPLYGIEADTFAVAILDGSPIPVSREDTLGNMRVLDELRRQVGVTMDT